MQDEQSTHYAQPEEPSQNGSFLEVLSVFTRLGLTSFGGPVAHLGYFRTELVERRKWVDDQSYADIVALCQFLPGPASSQVGIAMGLGRAGMRGALAAWLGFTLPSAIVLIIFAYGVGNLAGVADSAWLNGLKIVAVAVVAQAVWGMARTLAPDKPRATIAILAAIGVLAWQSPFMQIGVIIAAGAIAWRFFPKATLLPHKPMSFSLSRQTGVAALAIFGGLLFGLPLIRPLIASETFAIFDSFFRTGSLIFGGGHVMLPLIQAEVVPPGWVTNENFIAGYGAAQAIPGPLSTFAAYLGTIMDAGPGGWMGGTIALIAIFVPSFLLVIGVLPFWEGLRAREWVQSALIGINAAVVGILLAALYDPVWTSAIHRPADFGLGLVAFGLLVFWKLPPWMVVLFTAAGAAALAQIT
ncbi:MAG: chromate efflux transporter [Chloroflexia bacterium]|nr:chromate efflux transporter [Chloroflexia bacterium]